MSDELNTLNVKLFPPKAPPAQVRAWQVPLFTVKYEDFTDENRDVSMQKVRKLHPPRDIQRSKGDSKMTDSSINDTSRHRSRPS